MGVPLINGQRLFGASTLLAAAVLACASHRTTAFAAPGTLQVVIEGMQFSPQSLVVKSGDTVVWVNKDAFAHDATAIDGSFKTKPIAPMDSWKFKADKKGAFAYICTIHTTMKGSLTVE